MTASPFAALIGQPQATELLTRTVERRRVAPAYLFAGADGVGRSLAARGFIELLFQATSSHPRALAKRIWEGNHPDVLWIEPTFLHQKERYTVAQAREKGLTPKSPPQIRIEQIRHIARSLARPPLEADRTLVVIEQAETMPEAAANALLKTLEEPGRATLILIAPSAESLLPTLVSRCARIPFYALSAQDMARVLVPQGYGEILQDPAIAAIAQGSPGRAIAAWQQLQAIQALDGDLLTRLEEFLQAGNQRNESTSGTRMMLEALQLARDLQQKLDAPAQLWLLDYLQSRYWQVQPKTPHHLNRVRQVLNHLEKARRCLLQYVQPLLVWEVTLMAIASGETHC